MRQARALLQSPVEQLFLAHPDVHPNENDSHPDFRPVNQPRVLLRAQRFRVGGGRASQMARDVWEGSAEATALKIEINDWMNDRQRRNRPRRRPALYTLDHRAMLRQVAWARDHGAAV